MPFLGQKTCHFFNYVATRMYVCFGLPQHVHKFLVIFFIHCYVFWQLWVEPIIWHTSHRTPGPCTIHYSPITCCRLKTGKSTIILLSNSRRNLQSMHEMKLSTCNKISIEWISDRIACVTLDSGYAELHQETDHLLLLLNEHKQIYKYEIQ